MASVAKCKKMKQKERIICPSKSLLLSSSQTRIDDGPADSQQFLCFNQKCLEINQKTFLKRTHMNETGDIPQKYLQEISFFRSPKSPRRCEAKLFPVSQQGLYCVVIFPHWNCDVILAGAGHPWAALALVAGIRFWPFAHSTFSLFSPHIWFLSSLSVHFI